MRLCINCRYYSAETPGRPFQACLHPLNLRRSPVDGEYFGLEGPFLARSQIGHCHEGGDRFEGRTRSPMSGVREERIGDPSSTTHTLEGPKILVEQRVWELLEEYQPAGYGTELSSRTILPDGELRATVKRLSSCD